MERTVQLKDDVAPAGLRGAVGLRKYLTGVFGYTRKRDLSGLGSFLMIGLIGVIAVSMINLFLASGPLAMSVWVIGVIVFTGVTAWDMQRLRNEYLAHHRTAGLSVRVDLGKL
jgi:FtsH-binding integral membrane protein